MICEYVPPPVGNYHASLFLSVLLSPTTRPLWIWKYSTQCVYYTHKTHNKRGINVWSIIARILTRIQCYGWRCWCCCCDVAASIVVPICAYCFYFSSNTLLLSYPMKLIGQYLFRAGLSRQDEGQVLGHLNLRSLNYDGTISSDSNELSL